MWGTGKNGNDIRLAGGRHQFSLECACQLQIKQRNRRFVANKAQTEVLWASKSKEEKLINWPIDHSAPPTTFFKSTNRKCLPDAAEVAVATLHVPVPSPHFQDAVSPTLGKNTAGGCVDEGGFLCSKILFCCRDHHKRQESTSLKVWRTVSFETKMIFDQPP